jgi:GMP synthase (glutamine-hydrolysing)
VRVLTVVHQRDAGPGVFAEAAAAGGDELVEWVPADGEPPPRDFDAAMVFGGAMHVDQEDEHPWLRSEKELLRTLLEARVPLLGVCLGAQLVAEAAGAAPHRAARPEIGWHAVELAPAAVDDPVLGPLPRRFQAFGWHSYEAPLPPGATALGRSALCLQAFRVDPAPAWGIQFHAEVRRSDVERWVADSREDEDAAAAAIDPDEIAAETDRRIDGWNDLGRGLARRFLDHCAAER